MFPRIWRSSLVLTATAVATFAPCMATTGTASAAETVSSPCVKAPAEHIQKFSTTWEVPEAPEDAEGHRGFSISTGIGQGALQPELVWQDGYKLHVASTKGADPDDMDDKGEKAEVEPGTSVTGVVELVSAEAGKYTYKGYFIDHDETAVSITVDEPLIGVTECLKASAKAALPDQESVTMEQIELTTQAGHEPPDTLTWTAATEQRTTRGDREAASPSASSSESAAKRSTKSGATTEVVNASATEGQLDLSFPTERAAGERGQDKQSSREERDSSAWPVVLGVVAALILGLAAGGAAVVLVLRRRQRNV